MGEYSVVKFYDEDVVSEVPTIWICGDKERPLCWWPKNSKNISLLISKKVPPNETWETYDIEVEQQCLSLGKARKMAEYISCSSSDEKQLGRGRKQIIPNVQSTSESEDDPQDYVTHSQQKGKKKPVLLSPPIVPSTLRNRHFVTEQNIADVNKTIDHTVHLPSADNINIQDTPILMMPISSQTNNNIVDITTSQDNKQTNDIVLLNEKIDEYFSKHTRMLAAINVNLTSINKRLSKLETNKIETPQNNALIKDFLPMKSVDNIKTFENVLTNSKDAASQFAALISNIGGNSPKNNIQRILLQIFDNSCATQCFWKGLRNNFGVSKLIAIKIMKDYIITTYPFFKADQFEVVIAEWFRFAKQRLHRETKES